LWRDFYDQRRRLFGILDGAFPNKITENSIYDIDAAKNIASTFNFALAWLLAW
jgi:hypothetical protein